MPDLLSDTYGPVDKPLAITATEDDRSL